MLKAKLSAALLIVLIASSANAANYLSLQYLNSTADLTEVDCDLTKAYANDLGYHALCQENDEGFRGAFGVELTNTFSVEIGYADLGDFYHGVEYNATAYDRFGSSIEGYDLSVVSRTPLGPQLNFFTRVGVFAWEQDAWYETSFGDGRSDTDRGNAWFFGAGVEFRGIHIGYELLNDVGSNDLIGESDIERYTLGARLDF